MGSKDIYLGATFDGSGDNEEVNQVADDSDAPVMLQHRSGMFGSPFASIFADVNENEGEDFAVDDEGGDEYEGDLEGFDIDTFADSEAVIKVQNAVM